MDATASPQNAPDDTFELVARALNVAYYEWVPDTNEVRASRALLHLFGQDLSTQPARSYLGLMHPHDVPQYQAAMRAFFKSSADRTETLYRFKVPDGRYAWVHNPIYVVRNAAGRVVRLVGTVADVTEAKQLEAENRALIARQAASIEVLKTISASPDDPQPVFELIARRTRELCHAVSASVTEYDGSLLYLRALNGFDAAAAEMLRRTYPRPADNETVAGRMALNGQIIHYRHYEREFAAVTNLTQTLRNLTRDQGVNSLLGVPLLREGRVIGGILLLREEIGGFDDAEIALAESFAEQAVIAIASATALREVRARTQELAKSLHDLHTTQDRLIQTEKLASLGQLTAGIAHEIKNPLNFVNNFSALSVDLIDELREALAPAPLEPAARSEVDEVTELLRGNLQKVVQHGKRADGIVRNMLLHAREGGGERRRVDFNATVEEAFNLAYHGARAERPGFNVTLERHYDPAAGSLELYPQEFTRVLLNLIGNGFYAVDRRRRDADDTSYVPTVAVTTEARPDGVIARVRDNGTGMPDAVKARLFEPFFTTKPAGEGTGLGLSISHDIIVKQHAGSIAVDSRLGEFTEFTITLPRTPAGAFA